MNDHSELIEEAQDAGMIAYDDTVDIDVTPQQVVDAVVEAALDVALTAIRDNPAAFGVEVKVKPLLWNDAIEAAAVAIEGDRSRNDIYNRPRRAAAELIRELKKPTSETKG